MAVFDTNSSSNDTSVTNGVMTVAQIKAPSTLFNSDVDPLYDVQLTGSEQTATIKDVEGIVEAIKSSFAKFIDIQRSYIDNNSNYDIDKTESDDSIVENKNESKTTVGEDRKTDLTEASISDIIKISSKDLEKNTDNLEKDIDNNIFSDSNISSETTISEKINQQLSDIPSEYTENEKFENIRFDKDYDKTFIDLFDKLELVKNDTISKIESIENEDTNNNDKNIQIIEKEPVNNDNNIKLLKDSLSSFNEISETIISKLDNFDIKDKIEYENNKNDVIEISSDNIESGVIKSLSLDRELESLKEISLSLSNIKDISYNKNSSINEKNNNIQSIENNVFENTDVINNEYVNNVIQNDSDINLDFIDNFKLSIDNLIERVESLKSDTNNEYIENVENITNIENITETEIPSLSNDFEELRQYSLSLFDSISKSIDNKNSADTDKNEESVERIEVNYDFIRKWFEEYFNNVDSIEISNVEELSNSISEFLIKNGTIELMASTSIDNTSIADAILSKIDKSVIFTRNAQNEQHSENGSIDEKTIINNEKIIEKNIIEEKVDSSVVDRINSSINYDDIEEQNIDSGLKTDNTHFETDYIEKSIVNNVITENNDNDGHNIKEESEFQFPYDEFYSMKSMIEKIGNSSYQDSIETKDKIDTTEIQYVISLHKEQSDDLKDDSVEKNTIETSFNKQSETKNDTMVAKSISSIQHSIEKGLEYIGRRFDSIGSSINNIKPTSIVENNIENSSNDFNFDVERIG